MKPFGRSHLLIRRIAILALAASLLAGAPIVRGGKKDYGADLSTPGPSASPSPARPKFDVPIPINHDAEVVKIPYSDAHGKKQMDVYTKIAFRQDLNHLELHKAWMQTYDEKGNYDIGVYFISSVLDLNTRIVTSDVPVTVSRSDFQIVGQKMTFNTQTRVGHMSGHVHMVIYNRQDMSQGPSPSPSPSPSPHPGATP